jgi:sterol desaturase/sphingolipid hydroxylase (fatty acid hydroxylase superfamily)
MRLSAISYYADFFLAAAAILVLTADLALAIPLAQTGEAFAFILLGFASWTLLEYFVHRVLYHNVPFFKEQHDAHHAAPRAFIGAPPVIGILLIFLITFVPAATASRLAADGLTIGMLAGYMAYMFLHHISHHWPPLPASSCLFQLRRHHALHHYHRLEGNYGITTVFWDYVFRTTLEPRTLSRPKVH